MAVAAFLVIIAVLGIAMYLTLIIGEVPGAVEQRFGELEALPENVGQWIVDGESDAGRAARTRGEVREVRYWHDPNGGFLGRGKLTRQVRYKSSTGEVVRVDPDEVVKRRRVRR